MRFQTQGVQYSNSSFEDCVFKDVDLSLCDLNQVSFTRCKFIGTKVLNTKFSGSYITECEISNMDISSNEFLNARITGTVFTHCDLSAVGMSIPQWSGKLVFKDCNLDKTCVSGELNDVRFENNTFESMSFGGSTLLKVNLKELDVFKIDFRGCKFSSTNMDLTGVNFSKADLRGANFQKCILRNVCFDGAQVKDSRFAHATICLNTLKSLTTCNLTAPY